MKKLLIILLLACSQYGNSQPWTLNENVISVRAYMSTEKDFKLLHEAPETDTKYGVLGYRDDSTGMDRVFFFEKGTCRMYVMFVPSGQPFYEIYRRVKATYQELTETHFVDYENGYMVEIKYMEKYSGAKFIFTKLK